MRGTIKSIAKDLGISHMTVSRALSGNPNVSAEKRAAIIARANEIGYVKSSAANAMRGQTTAIIGLLLPNIINEFYARFANTLGLRCAEQGLDLVIHLTNDDPKRERDSIQRLKALQASTIVMVPTPLVGDEPQPVITDCRVINLIRSRGPAVNTGTLLIDDGPSIEAAVDHLARSGHQQLAYIGAAGSLSSGQRRLQAFLRAQRQNNLMPNPDLVRTGSPSYAMGCENASSLLDAGEPIDALICGGFEISNGALDTCLKRGLKFPDDLAFVGYGDPSAYQWIAGGITTISLSADDIAEQAAAMLNDKETANWPKQETSPTRLVIRHSA